MSLTRRGQGALAPAAYWAQRSQEHLAAAGARGAAEEFDLALVRLLRAASGEYDMTGAVDDANHLLSDWSVALSLPRRAMLLVELGAAETWLGRLDAAADHLGVASAICRAADFRSLLPEALSRLAVVELLRARTVAALEAATASAESTPAGRGTAEGCRERVAVVTDLALRQTLAQADHPGFRIDLGAGGAARGRRGSQSARSGPDAATDLLGLLSSARAAAEHGLDGRAVLGATPQLRVDLSDYMALVLDLERCGYAVAAGDSGDLRAIAARLSALGATAESTCVEALLADMGADLTRADELFARVVSDELGPLLPVIKPHALVCSAQIADSRGQRRRADALMVEALRATAPERYAVPFLGWSFCGTPVPVLLSRVQCLEDSPWRRELYALVSGLEPAADPHHAHAPLLVEEKPTDVLTQAAIPPLTRRESDVLFALAHGSSYADIAAALVITENTVKTHVSSLYAKLGVTRRSPALHVARAAGLV
jgi:LuxR family transcriptional regulator, maltose regulon positive regulatory protein